MRDGGNPDQRHARMGTTKVKNQENDAEGTN